MKRHNRSSVAVRHKTMPEALLLDAAQLALVELTAESCAPRDAVAPAIRSLALEGAGGSTSDGEDAAGDGVLH